MAEPNFAELVDQARRGNQDAARALIERYESAIHRQVRFMLMDNRLKQLLDETDICQSVIGKFFLGLWAGQFEFDGPEQLIGLLKEMVRNKIVSQARYWKASRRDHRRNVTILDPDQPIEPISPEPTPSRVVADAELLVELERRLSERERVILNLRRQGKSWAEVSVQIGGGAEATRKRFERALDRVGRELGLRE